MMNLFLWQHFQPTDNHCRYLHPAKQHYFLCSCHSFGITSFFPWQYLQRQQPEMRGEDKLLLMIGGFHIKMNFVNLIGDWLTGSSRITTLTQAEVMSGHADAILKCSNLTRACYAHQVTAPSPGILKRTAYDTYMPTAILNLSLLKTGVTRKQRCIHSSNIGH